MTSAELDNLFGSSGPPTQTRTRNERPCRRLHLWPSGAFGSRWAASKASSLKTSKAPTGS